MIGKGQWVECGQDTGVLLFYEKSHGIFNDHRESGHRFYVSSAVDRDDCASFRTNIILGHDMHGK